MGVDLHLINELWYGIKDNTPSQLGYGVENNVLDYYTTMVVGIFLLRNPGITKKFVDQAWEDDPAEPEDETLSDQIPTVSCTECEAIAHTVNCPNRTRDRD